MSLTEQECRWQKRESTSPRASVALLDGPVLVAWHATPQRLDAVVAGHEYLGSLCTEVVPPNLRCALSDPEGRTLIGERPSDRMAATRTAASSGLPWTLHVFHPLDPAGSPPSPRRQLLMLTLTVVALVLVAGWFFILRAVTREVRVSQLQSDFVAAVSHEFRSPLTSLSHVAELLAHDRFPSDEVRRRSYDVLVRSTVTDFKERVAADGYTIELSGADEAMSTRADREALSRALWNLLDNAVKCSPECRTVWVEVTRQSEQISIAVPNVRGWLPSQAIFALLEDRL